MINPEAIKKLMVGVKGRQRLERGLQAVFNRGKLAAFVECLQLLTKEQLTIDNLQVLIDTATDDPYERGFASGCIDVGLLVKTDQARSRRNDAVNSATRYAEIQQGRL